ncbi:hypothetical protein EG68_11714 [Paragonimus skrjabini miyazakii]|uniref:Uncharacterized protein n=1 Tax=Paragonimus skrjabini miyazakii TaxID=59628 RepID=A0A8S9YE30_9TREM|nr:hypothetical protein EG68_11714 [Paragonimus skrjabini miyazakii]
MYFLELSQFISIINSSTGSVISGILYYNLSPVREPEKLVQENKTMQVQTDVCSQITRLVPWYQAQKNDSTCTINIGKQITHVNYTILATDDFVRKYDPSCVTYDILLANQVGRSPAFGGKYYLIDRHLESRNPTQSAGPSSADTGLTKIRVDGPLYKQGGLLRWDEFNTLDAVSNEVVENVRRQFTQFLRLDPDNGSYVNTEQRRIYSGPNRQIPIRMEAQITFNNSMLVANGINYTCPPFKELVKASLESVFFYSLTSYFREPISILDQQSDGGSSDNKTTAPAPDSNVTMEPTTPGGVDQQSDGGSSDNKTTAPAPDSNVTMEPTTPGSVGDENNLAIRLNNLTLAHFVHFAYDALCILSVEFPVIGCLS